jgi:hypothetical protein
MADHLPALRICIVGNTGPRGQLHHIHQEGTERIAQSKVCHGPSDVKRKLMLPAARVRTDSSAKQPALPRLTDPKVDLPLTGLATRNRPPIPETFAALQDICAGGFPTVAPPAVTV